MHWMKSSIKWRLPNICLVILFNSAVRYHEQDSNERDYSSNVNWSNMSHGDIYVNKRNNFIIQVSWKVDSISYVSGLCGIKDEINENVNPFQTDSVNWLRQNLHEAAYALFQCIYEMQTERGRKRVIFLSQIWTPQHSSFKIYFCEVNRTLFVLFVKAWNPISP